MSFWGFENFLIQKLLMSFLMAFGILLELSSRWFYSQCLEHINRVAIVDVDEDELVWNHLILEIFPMKLAYEDLRPHNIEIFYSFSSRKLMHGKVLTEANLQTREFSLASICRLCVKCGESIHYLFIECPFCYSL